MGAWTKGPWRAAPDYWRDVQTADGALAICVILQERDAGETLDIVDAPLPPASEAEANARLVAAAPDLAEALASVPDPDRAESTEEFEDAFRRWRKVARAALAKAGGSHG